MMPEDITRDGNEDILQEIEEDMEGLNDADEIEDD
jgi:hypothetical protein